MDIKINEDEKVISLTLKVPYLDTHGVVIKHTTKTISNLLKEQGHEITNCVRAATVDNRFEDTLIGTWVFGYVPEPKPPPPPVKATTAAKRTRRNKKYTKTSTKTTGE
jgi:hypothetical protein